MRQSLDDRSIFEPSAIELATVDVDVESELITERTVAIGHPLQLFKVARILCGVLLQFDD